MGRVNESNLDQVMSFQPIADDSQIAAFTAVNDAAKHLISVILQYVPLCADQTEAIRQVRLARMWANSAIALRGEI